MTTTNTQFDREVITTQVRISNIPLTGKLDVVIAKLTELNSGLPDTTQSASISLITDKSFILDVERMETDEEYKMRLADTIRDIDDEISEKHFTVHKLYSIMNTIGK